MDNKISIIIPVYNTEAFVREAIESALAQAYKNIEIIIVDDGSKDKSREICDEYGARYSNITVVHQENQGASGARNAGLELACGEYILFFDSDDILTEYAASVLMQKAVDSGADMIMPEFYFCIDESGAMLGEKYHFSKQLCIEEPRDFALKVMMGASRGWRTHSLLIKRAGLEKHHIRFREDITIAEDFVFNLDCMKAFERLAFIHESTVYYRTRKNSTTSKFHQNYLEGIWKLEAAAEQFIAEMQIPVQEAELYRSSFVIQEIITYITDIFAKAGDLSQKQKRKEAGRVISNHKVRMHMKARFKDIYFTSRFAVLYYRVMKILIQFRINGLVYILASVAGGRRGRAQV